MYWKTSSYHSNNYQIFDVDFKLPSFFSHLFFSVLLLLCFQFLLNAYLSLNFFFCLSKTHCILLQFILFLIAAYFVDLLVFFSIFLCSFLVYTVWCIYWRSICTRWKTRLRAAFTMVTKWFLIHIDLRMHKTRKTYHIAIESTERVTQNQSSRNFFFSFKTTLKCLAIKLSSFFPFLMQSNTINKKNSMSSTNVNLMEKMHRN